MLIARRNKRLKSLISDGQRLSDTFSLGLTLGQQVPCASLWPLLEPVRQGWEWMPRHKDRPSSCLSIRRTDRSFDVPCEPSNT